MSTLILKPRIKLLFYLFQPVLIVTFDSILPLIILVAAIQGFIVTAILFFSDGKLRISNRYLSALIFLISYASLGVYLMQIGIKYTSVVWMTISQVVPFFVVMPIGPLIYFYVQTFSSPNSYSLKNHVWHFTTILIDVLPQILFILFFAGIFRLSIVSLTAFVDEYNTYADIPRWASVTFYLILSLRFLKGVDQRRDAEIKKLKWLRQFINVFLVFQTIWLAHLIPYIVPSLKNGLLESVGWYPVYLPLAGLIYYFGIKGIIVSNTLTGKIESVPNQKLSPEKVALTLTRLRNVMVNDKLYLKPSLTVAGVAKHIDIPAKQISSVLNQVESKSFNEFINYYRVEDFKDRIRDPRLNFMTISGVALECGFNSQATFQRTFKALEGMSPTEYFNLHKHEQQISA